MKKSADQARLENIDTREQDHGYAKNPADAGAALDKGAARQVISLCKQRGFTRSRVNENMAIL